jgi:hypothetical protein
MPAKTIRFATLTNPCPICDGLTYLEGHLSAMKVPEVLVVKCEKCGEIKRLFSTRPQPIYEDIHVEAVLGEKTKRPRKRKEI